MIDTKHYCDGGCTNEPFGADQLTPIDLRLNTMANCSPQCIRANDEKHDFHRTDLKAIHLCDPCLEKYGVKQLLSLSRQ